MFINSRISRDDKLEPVRKGKTFCVETAGFVR